MNIIKAISQAILRTPFYPFWLDNINEGRGNREMLKCLFGVVLETGAGNCLKKPLAEKVGFRIVSITTYCCFGTTLASLITQYTIRKILEGNKLTKTILPPSPLIFFVSNSIGYLLDRFEQDDIFAQRYHVLMRKI